MLKNMPKKKKLKIWKRYNPKFNKDEQLSNTSNTKDFTGKVVEIVNPGTIKVIPKGTKKKGTETC